MRGPTVGRTSMMSHYLSTRFNPAASQTLGFPPRNQPEVVSEGSEPDGFGLLHRSLGHQQPFAIYCRVTPSEFLCLVSACLPGAYIRNCFLTIK